MSKLCDINSEYVLRQSVRYLKIAFGDMQAPINFNPAGVKGALELIGKNASVKAFQDSIEVSHTHYLEELLTHREKQVEAAAVRRRLKLVE